MSAFEFPTNIKQIGSIGEGIRIYIEDYACSYLQQYAEAGGYEERLAFLVGRTMIIDGQTILFISGLVQGLYTTVEKDMITFTERSWQHAKEEIKRYFKGSDIVGWMQSQPGFGTHLNESYANAHTKLFTRQDQVLFIIDPAEKLNAFYIYDERQEKLVESQGYFIYYDKNRGMHEYMLDNRILKMKMRPLSEIEDAASPVIRQKKEAGEASKKPPLVLGIAPRKTLRRHGKKTAGNQRRLVNLMVSLSAALFLVCFIMGAGLVQSGGRLNTMEKQLTQLNTAYRDLLLQFKDDRTMTVFANQNDVVANEVAAQAADAGQAVLITENGNEALDVQAVTQPEAELDNQQTELYLPDAQQAETTLLPTPTPAPTHEEGTNETTATDIIPDTYTVQFGDSLSYISLKFYGTRSMIDEIITLNDLDDADKIYFGKVLKLPKRNE